MDNRFYAFHLDDPAVPAIATASKLYIGQRDAILAVTARLEEAGSYPETTDAVRRYFDGQKNVTHTVACRKYPVLKPLYPLAMTQHSIPHPQWTHRNAWDSEYVLRADSADVTQIVVRYGGEYVRCVKACFYDLCYRFDENIWQPIGRTVFGHESVLDITDTPGRSLRNLLFVVEDRSKTSADMISKIQDPGAVIFDRVMDEVFGDG